MHVPGFLKAAAVAAAVVAPVELIPAAIVARQSNANSTCEVFGIDFQDGGSYFINTNSNQSFTAVSKFEGCNNDTASILLVNEASGDEYECTSVATVPNDEAMLSTCPIQKNQITSGKYLILALGNNGNGNPFAYQREFSIDAGAQQTTTVTPTATYSVTITPTVNVESTSTIIKTSHVTNNMTITEPVTTQVTTTTPAEVTVTSTSTNIRTFWRWTSTQSVQEISVTPSCTVPVKPRFPDPPCTIIPKNFALPTGLTIHPRGDKSMDVEYVRKRFEDHRAAKARSAAGEDEAKSKRQMEKRAADQPTLTVTASVAVNTTSTITASPTTITDIDVISQTVYTTDPPKTVEYGTYVSVITAPTPTDVINTVAYTRDYVTKTWAVTWTRTVTVTPTASASACQKEGGHFGPVWGGGWGNGGGWNNGGWNNDSGNGGGNGGSWNHGG